MSPDAQVVDSLPPSGRGKVDWAVMTAKAREVGPTKWVRTPIPLDPTVAYQIRQGMYASVDETEFTAQAGKVDGQTYVFLRVLSAKEQRGA